MKRTWAVWPYVVRIAWPALGGVWGAWVGFQGYFNVPLNSDTAAPLVVWGFFAFYALIGLCAGAASGALIGWSVEWLLRKLGVGMAVALCSASVVTVIALWGIGEVVQEAYPGLRTEKVKDENRKNAPVDPVHSDQGGDRNTRPVPDPKKLEELEKGISRN